MKTYLLLDMSNLLYRTFYANIKENDDILISMCHHSGLTTMQYLNNKYNPDEIVAVFDSHSWRKDYTKYASISHKKYKGQRRQDLTTKEAQQLEVFDKHICEFYEYLRDYSSLIVLKRNLLECDDLVAGFVDLHEDDKHIIISSDKDFIQLLDNPNVTLIEPAKEEKRTLMDWNMDAKYFMFEKCLRGDNGDNVHSAYPRLRKDKIDKAYNGDTFLKANIMAHEFDVDTIDADGKVKTYHYKTEDLFKENILLTDLRSQPDEIKTLIATTIYKALKSRNKFNVKEFLKFCGRYDLQRISDNPKFYTKMLSTKSKDVTLFG